MSKDFIQFAFSAGVISPTFYYRPDLEKFDLGLREGFNWFIDYRGGASVRPPLEFIDEIEGDVVKFWPFRLNQSLANTYLMIFGHHYIRFVQDGAYVLEDEISLSSITIANPAVFTTGSAHGYDSGDWVKLTSTGMPELQGRTFIVNRLSSTTFQLTDVKGVVISTLDLAAHGTSSVSRIYTVPTTYHSSQLKELALDQHRNTIYITHTSYEPATLVRNDTLDWVLTANTYGGSIDAPGTLTLAGSGAGTAGMVYGTTAVGLDGLETPMTNQALIDNIVNISSTAGQVTVRWAPVADAAYYKVYRSIIFIDGGQATLGQDMGYLGESSMPEFVDSNIIPDFSSVPPVAYNPFALGGIQHINVETAGSGYVPTTTYAIAITGSGSGFSGRVVVSPSGEVVGILVQEQGEGYSDTDTLTISGGAGSGATFSLKVTASTGRYPGTSVAYKQRRIYAGTVEAPINLFGTKPGHFTVFDFTSAGGPADGIELELDSATLTPIQHILPFSNGLFFFLDDSVHQIRSADDAIFSNTTLIAEPFFNYGASALKPLRLGETILFMAYRSAGVYSIEHGSNHSIGTHDRGIFSNHYFTGENEIIAWASLPVPLKLVIAVREDGSLLYCTYVPEHNVYAWTEGETEGYFRDVATIIEGAYDRAYFAVEREGCLYLERHGLLQIETVEDLGAMDSYLDSELTYPSGTLYVAPTPEGDGTTRVSSLGLFTGAVGKDLRVGTGKGTISSVSGSSTGYLTWDIEPTPRKHPTDDDNYFVEGLWSLTDKTSTVTGLWHLENQVVEVFADGMPQANQTVTDGGITLETAASKIRVGLGYLGYLSTLPLASPDAVIQNDKKRVAVAGLRVKDTRGLKLSGYGSTSLYALEERRYEGATEPTRIQNGVYEMAVEAALDTDGSITITKDEPMLATVLGIVTESEIGDT